MPQLSLSTAGVMTAQPARRIIDWAAATGFRAILIDAARPEFRPRELDRSARRGLASLLRRLELTLAGAELWIPPAHYGDPSNAERAVSAATSAIRLIADLAGLVEADRTLTLTLPRECADEAVSAIEQAAVRHDVRIADCHRPRRAVTQDSPIGAGIDPSLIDADGQSAIDAVITCDTPPLAARWPAPGRRADRAPDPQRYASALSIAGFDADVALDLRDAIDPQNEAPDALERWIQADPFST